MIVRRRRILFCIICCILIFTQETASDFISACYNVNNYRHCLSTDLTLKTWLDAKAACRANNSVLISVTSNDVQSVTEQFRSYVNSSYPAIDNAAVWIDVATDAIDSFHWITISDRGSPRVYNQNSDDRRFGVIANISNNVVYSAEKWNEQYYYICQYQDVGCVGGHQRSSKCYVKYNNEIVTWFTASNRCLSMGGSLATFNDLIITPTDDVSLASWLNVTGTTGYWIGLARRWFVTAGQNGSVVDVQYTNWLSGYPSQSPNDDSKSCVALRAHGSAWIDGVYCANKIYFVCQVLSPLLMTTPARATSVTERSSSTTIADSTYAKEQSTTTSTSLINSQSTSASFLGSDMTKCYSLSTVVGLAVGLGVPLTISVIIVVALLMHIKNLSQPVQSNVQDPAGAEAVNSTPVYTSLSNHSLDGANTVYTQLHETKDANGHIEYETVK